MMLKRHKELTPPTIMLEAGGALSSTTTAVTKALMGVFTGLEMALIKSMTVGSCTQYSCRIGQHGATEGVK
jgi:hypothetical protein